MPHPTEQFVSLGDEGATVPPCEPSELALSLRWERSGDALVGEVVAENVGERACRVGGKPTLRPLDAVGAPLPAQQVVTAEMRIPPYAVVAPGQRAAARVVWAGWCGEPASGRVRVGWAGGSTVVDAQGPTQPDCPDEGSGNLSSSWFDLID